MSAATPPIIREATADDLPRLVELLFDLSQMGETPQGVLEPVSPRQVAVLAEMQADPRIICWVIEVGGKVAGSLVFYLLPNLSHGARPGAIVENVVVDPAQRGLGLGRLLMEHAEAEARARGCYKISLTSNRRREDAHRFYDGLGYHRSHVGFSKYFDDA
jgi:GNAT superfamily N-acetyltransferase